MEISTKKSYEEVYSSYYKMKDEYGQYNPNLESFFEDSLTGNFNKLNIIFTHILSDLKRGENNADNSESENPDDKQNSIFSLEAMLERRIEIIDVKLVQ